MTQRETNLGECETDCGFAADFVSTHQRTKDPQICGIHALQHGCAAIDREHRTPRRTENYERYEVCTSAAEGEVFPAND